MLQYTLIATLNHLLKRNDWALERLQNFAGREALFVMPPWRLQFRIDADGFLSAAKGTPDVEVTLPVEMPLLFLQEQEEAMRSAQIRGSADFAEALSFVLRHLSWGFEEDLSRLIGDVLAHRIAESLRSFGRWQKEAARNLAENVAEQLGAENSPMLQRFEFAGFATELSQVQEELVRLEQRILGLKS